MSISSTQSKDMSILVDFFDIYSLYVDTTDTNEFRLEAI